LREGAWRGLNTRGKGSKQEGKLARFVNDCFWLAEESLTDHRHVDGKLTCGPTYKLRIRQLFEFRSLGAFLDEDLRHRHRVPRQERHRIIELLASGIERMLPLQRTPSLIAPSGDGHVGNGSP
jgi:hypothetical protein